MSSAIELKKIFLQNPLFFFGYISIHYPLSKNHLGLLKADLFWDLISLNENIHFTVPLIAKYIPLLNKKDLAYNKSIAKDNALLKYFCINSNPLEQKEYLEYESLRNKIKSDFDYHPDVSYHKFTFYEIEQNKTLIDWKHFSSNELIKWNKEILYKYKDYYWFGENLNENEYITDGLELYNNESVPWDTGVIKLFERKLLNHKEVIKQFLNNRTLIKNLKPIVTEDFFNNIIIELKF